MDEQGRDDDRGRAVPEDRFFIGGLADRAGVTRDTIRFYESTGVLPEPERTRTGYRRYGPEDVDRLEFIAQAQTLGLTLDEIAEIFEITDEGREPCIHVRGTLRARLDQTRRRIQELRALEGRLETALNRAVEADAAGDDTCRCPIIEEGSEESLPPSNRRVRAVANTSTATAPSD